MTALGQTIFWDEPTKAVLLDSLARYAPDSKLLLSVMDTDYFAKPPVDSEGFGEYSLLPHNDTTTKDLWVATGELARLFGCEAIPTRDFYHRHGVRLEQAAGANGDNVHQFIDKMTEAWGWLGLAHTGSRRSLAGEIPLSGASPKLMEQLEWGFRETVGALLDPTSRREAEVVAESWLQEARDFASQHPDASITDLYQYLLPRMVAALEFHSERAPSPLLEIGASMERFRFNRRTADRPEFEMLDLFLRPKTKDAAREAYDDAVRGSDIYTLDHFALGAIPFDLVIPGLGRGTIRIIPERVIIELEERIYLRITRPIESARDLADAVEERLGRGVSLVGKALTLIPMLARAALVVLNETGSTYIWRTRKMIEGLCQKGVTFELYPIVRLRLPVWDSVGVIGQEIRLPKHLAQAFDAETISSEEFARRWREALQGQRELLEEAASAVSPRETMEFLTKRTGENWNDLRREYDRHKSEMLELRDRLRAIKTEKNAIRVETRELKAECDALQKRKGLDFRERILPLREELRKRGVRDFETLSGHSLTLSSDSPAYPKIDGETAALFKRFIEEMERRKSFDDERDAIRLKISERAERLNALNRERETLIRDERIIAIRRSNAEIAVRAQAAKLEIVRNAFLASEGLEHTDYRPAAWWLLLLSPDGKWFRRIREKTVGYLEPLSCRPPRRDPVMKEERKHLVRCGDRCR